MGVSIRSIPTADVQFDWFRFNQTNKSIHNCNITKLGVSPGLVVMGGGSRSKGRGLESRRRILDGHDIFHINLL